MSANRVANLFMIFRIFAPLKGWRRVAVTDRHAAVDHAKVLKDLSDGHLPAAEKIVLVQDNLSTHAPASLYPPSPPPKRAASSKGSNGVTTPKHRSRLDMAESELAVLTRPCLSRRTTPSTPSRKKCSPGSATETSTTPKPIGNSQRTTPASNSKGCALSSNDAGD
jgi:hypothetical protein